MGDSDTCKENIKDNIKNRITLTINITTSPTIFVKLRWQNHICLLSFSMLIILLYYSKFVYIFDKYLLIKFVGWSIICHKLFKINTLSTYIANNDSS